MTSEVRITVLVENTAQGAGMLAEHGLAYKLGIPLREAAAIVLSHGHYDHTGGLAEVLGSHRPAPIYAHPAAFHAKYARHKDGTVREIGMPVAVQEALRRRSRNVIATELPTAILKGLAATGYVPRATDFENAEGPFFLDDARGPPHCVDRAAC